MAQPVQAGNDLDELARDVGERLRNDPAHQAKVAKIRSDLAQGRFRGEPLDHEGVNALRRLLLDP